MTTTYYRVQQVSSGHPREYLTGAMTYDSATATMQSIAENMQANGYLRTDQTLIRKLPVIMLARELRTITLSVVECSADDITGTRTELQELPTWLTRPVEPVLNGIEEPRDYTVDPDLTPIDPVMWQRREGMYVQPVVSEVAANG